MSQTIFSILQNCRVKIVALDHDRHIKTSPIGSTSIPLKDVKTLSSSSTAASTAPIKMTNFLTAKKQVSSHLG